MTQFFLFYSTTFNVKSFAKKRLPQFFEKTNTVDSL